MQNFNRRRKTKVLEMEDEKVEYEPKSHQLSNSIKITNRIGQTHGDTIYFDDLPVIFEKLNSCKWENWRIQAITFVGDSYSNGLQIHYNINGETIEAPKHAGNHHNPKENLVVFEKGEEIIGISGGCGAWMDSITIITNKREIRSGTSDGGARFHITLSYGSRVVSICGGTGGHIHNVGLVFIPVSWSPSTHQSFSQHFQQIVKTLLKLTLRDSKGNSRHPDSKFGNLPRDLLFYLFEILSWEETSQNKVNYNYGHSLRFLDPT